MPTLRLTGNGQVYEFPPAPGDEACCDMLQPIDVDRSGCSPAQAGVHFAWRSSGEVIPAFAGEQDGVRLSAW